MRCDSWRSSGSASCFVAGRTAPLTTKAATYKRSPDAAHRWWPACQQLRTVVEFVVDYDQKNLAAPLDSTTQMAALQGPRPRRGDVPPGWPAVTHPRPRSTAGGGRAPEGNDGRLGGSRKTASLWARHAVPLPDRRTKSQAWTTDRRRAEPQAVSVLLVGGSANRSLTVAAPADGNRLFRSRAREQAVSSQNRGLEEAVKKSGTVTSGVPEVTY